MQRRHLRKYNNLGIPFNAVTATGGVKNVSTHTTGWVYSSYGDTQIQYLWNRQNGVVVNISSIRGVVPNDFDRIPYEAAKAGQINLTRSFVQESS